MTGKLEIQWSPINNKFITWGSDICLYEVQPIRDSNTQDLRISNTLCAHLLATNSSIHYIKSIDIYPKSESDLLLAVGLSNGRIALSTFGPSEFDHYGFPGKELVPKHGRQCNAVAFNPNECHLLATGLEKHRQDNGVLIWDIMKCASNSDNKILDQVKPIAEFGNSEVAHSMDWFHSNSKVLACGMNLKYIRMYDIRDPSKWINSALTKAVYGLCVNPTDDRHVASFCDNTVSIWDTRNFEKPILLLPHIKSLSKISWCPTKYNLLGTLQKESNVINLYDIQHTIVGSEEVEPSILERVAVPGSASTITSFSWHFSDENRFLTIARSEKITDYTVFDRITLNWAPSSNMVWTYGRKTMKCVDDTFLCDISTKIKERSKNRYGLEDELYKNANKVENNEVLSNVWNWLHLSARLVDDGTVRGTNNKHPGVQSILKLDPNNSKSECVTVAWTELGFNCQGSAKYYKHDDREKALYLCSWPLDNLQKFLEDLERENAYSRAAAIALFTLKLRTAMDVLTRVPESKKNGSLLNIVGMALAGFTDDKNSAWRQLCLSTKARLPQPYLKAMFNFLIAENYNYDAILYETGITVDDRVAFACMFLPDNKLYEYLKKLTETLIEEGNLDGLLLTGNGPDGLKLLQKYLDATGDIQSTALIAIRAFTNDLQDERVRNWIESYRNLLDTWKMWNERADFDIKLAQYRPQEKPPKQVYVSCNFCGKSVSAYMHELNRGRQYPRMGGTVNKLKISSCPYCRKPLPRCAICLMHMGTTTGDIGTESNSKISEFDNWFTWCQTCRHGGHAAHMIKWFDEHQECPVTACPCRCFAIDSGITS